MISTHASTSKKDAKGGAGVGFACSALAFPALVAFPSLAAATVTVLAAAGFLRGCFTPAAAGLFRTPRLPDEREVPARAAMDRTNKGDRCRSIGF